MWQYKWLMEKQLQDAAKNLFTWDCSPQLFTMDLHCWKLPARHAGCENYCLMKGNSLEHYLLVLLSSTEVRQIRDGPFSWISSQLLSHENKQKMGCLCSLPPPSQGLGKDVGCQSYHSASYQSTFDGPQPKDTWLPPKCSASCPWCAWLQCGQEEGMAALGAWHFGSAIPSCGQL